MGKIIFWLLIVFGALLALRLVNVAKDRSRRDAGGSPAGGRPSDPARSRAAATVRCVECGVFLPRSEAIDTARGPACGDARCRRRPSRTAA